LVYDRESAAWQRRRDEPEHRELVNRIAGELATVVAPPGPVADLGCGPGAHAPALARRGYDVAGVDGSPRMVEAARTRAAGDKVGATFDVPRPWRARALLTCRSPRSGGSCQVGWPGSGIDAVSLEWLVFRLAAR
jgi:SAM-dependent methyltransferase